MQTPQTAPINWQLKLNQFEQVYKDHRNFLLQQIQIFSANKNQDAVAGLQIALTAWDRQYQSTRHQLEKHARAAEAARQVCAMAQEKVRRQMQLYHNKCVPPQAKL
jgi:hypothetical protein